MSQPSQEKPKFGVRYGKVVSTPAVGQSNDVSNVRLEVWKEAYVSETSPEDLIREVQRLVHEGLLSAYPTAAETDSKIQTKTPSKPKQAAASQFQPHQAPPTATPQEDPAKVKALESLRWTLYNPPHRAGWAFRDQAPAWLIERIQKETFVYLGEFRYSLSGAQHQFLTRNPTQRRQEAH